MAEEKKHEFPMRATRSVVKTPTKEQMKEHAAENGFQIREEDWEDYMALADGYLDSFRLVDKLQDFVPRSPYPRTSGYKPDSTENKYNAWHVKAEVKGRPGGLLEGKTVVLKDNICLAGVPMMNGSAILEGYVPDVDATVVSRILDAGGTIVGKAHSEDQCFSGGSHTCAAGPVHNPHKHGYMAGGSSSGSGALVAAKEVDMAMGGDQGGSIRIPASMCGIYGMKPTFGLVPYTGIGGILHTIDHTGPMTNTVQENALLLEALAGPDGLDARQGPCYTFPRDFDSSNPLPAAGHDYRTGIEESVKGMKIGFVKEGLAGCQDAVIQGVQNAAKVFQGLGVTVDEVSIPFHSISAHIWSAIGFSAACSTQCFQNASGSGYSGLYVTSYMDYLRDAWKVKSNLQSETGKLVVMISSFIEKNFGAKFHGKGQNLARQLTRAYDRVLNDYDVLIMPTLPIVADKIPEPDASPKEIIRAGLNMISNTASFNLTGHPAMSIPCGKNSEGLPIGLMIVGRKLHEKTIYNFAYNFEQNFDWEKHVTEA